MKKLTQEEVQEYLGLYHKEFRLIEDVFYEKGVLTARIIPFKYSFTQEDLDYLTATQIHLYLSQLTYILVGSCLKDKNYNILSKHIDYDFFIKKMYEGRLFFVDIKQKMKKIIYKNEKSVECTIKLNDFKIMNGVGFSNISFEIQQRSCIGDILISMKL